MEGEPPWKKVRKGTKSCIECRRRKVRCTWQNDDDSTCDGCRARHLSCRSQELAFNHEYHNSVLKVAPSCDGVLRLERRLEELADHVRRLEREIVQDDGAKHSGSHNKEPHDQAQMAAMNHLPLDHASDLPEGFLTHIRSLFAAVFVEAKGSILRTASPPPPPSCDQSAKYEELRIELIRLIPCDNDIGLVLKYALDWWELVDAGVPSVSIGSKSELCAVLERLRKPDSDPALIALWLVTAAVTYQQIPPDIDRTVFADSAVLRAFPENIMMRIEAVLATHQEIAATVCGIECSLMLVKLWVLMQCALSFYDLIEPDKESRQLNCGHVRRAWLTLRAGIACAEVIGLPDTCRSPFTLTRLAQQDGIVSTRGPSSPVLKASIWIQFCTLDRILGVLLNLPCTTRARPSQLPRYLLRHNSAGRELFWSLSDTAIKIRDRDDNIALSETDTGWIAETEAIERELQEHADTAGMCDPEQGFGEGKKFYEHSGVLPLPLFHQHVYFYLLLRTHLPLMIQGARTTTPALRQTAAPIVSTAFGFTSEAISREAHSHALCVYACTRMGRVYLQQTTGSSRGLFPIRICDFMAFTAIIILMLEQEGVLKPAMPVSSSTATMYRDTSGDAKLLEELIAMLKQTARQEGRAIAVQAVKAVESIRAILAMQDDPASPGMSIRIPLLGTMCIRRRIRRSRSVPPDSRVDFHSSVNVGQSADRRQHQAATMQSCSGALDANTVSWAPNSTDSFADAGIIRTSRTTPLPHGLKPDVAICLSNSPAAQSRCGSLPPVQSSMSMSVEFGSKDAVLSDQNQDRHDWVAEMMDTFDIGATSTQDALWSWNENTLSTL